MSCGGKRLIWERALAGLKARVHRPFLAPSIPVVLNKVSGLALHLNLFLYQQNRDDKLPTS